MKIKGNRHCKEQKSDTIALAAFDEFDVPLQLDYTYIFFSTLQCTI